LLTHALVSRHLIRCERVPLGICLIHTRIEYALALVHVDQDYARWRGVLVVVHKFYALIGCLRIDRALQDPLSAEGELILNLLGEVVCRDWLM
jgi:hypothetical protein